jgi:hypothetical protein
LFGYSIAWIVVEANETMGWKPSQSLNLSSKDGRMQMMWRILRIIEVWADIWYSWKEPLLQWKGVEQRSVTLSTAEAKLSAATACAQDAVCDATLGVDWSQSEEANDVEDW